MAFFYPFPGADRMCLKGEVSMVVRKRPVTKNSPCPICGKPDYCWWKEREDHPGFYNLYCNRTSEAKGTIVSGVDGNDYVAIFEKDPGTIYQNIREREEMFGKSIEGEAVKSATPRNCVVIDAVEPLEHERLDQAYRILLSILPLYDYHVKYLISEGWNLDLLEKHHICSMPVRDYKMALPEYQKCFLTREAMADKTMKILGWKDLKGVPGAYLNRKGAWTWNSMAGIVFPVYDEDGFIYRLRLRLDYMDLPVKMLKDQKGFYYMDSGQRVDVAMGGPAKTGTNGERIKIQFESHKGKYRPITSFLVDNDAYKSGFIENRYHKGCEAGNVLGFAMSPNDNYSVFWVTEGEKKGLYTNYVLKQPVLWLPGVNSIKLVEKPHHGVTPLEVMRQHGARMAIIAFDADKATNDMVMKCHQKLAERLKQNGFTTYSAEWNMTDGKGIDDLLSAGKLPKFKKL